MRKAAAAAGVWLIILTAGADARQLRVERDKVLAAVGEVLPEHIELAPVLPGPGRVLRQAVSKGPTSSLRLHFTIVQQPADPSWHMEIETASGARQRYRPEPGEEEFWTGELRGRTATIELFTTAANVGLKLVLDQVVVTKPPVKPKSISPDGDQLERYSGQPEPIRTIGRSVVRLSFIDDEKKKVFTCSGFLVFTSSHILTNEHCINSNKEMRSAVVDFDFDGGSAVPRSVKLARLLMTDPALDFSLLELAEPADRGVLTLKAGADADDRPLVIVQHPGGEVKQVSIRGCKVKRPQINGTTAATTDFGHLCDTLGGSSGSPVFDLADFTVVGLHHFGFFDGDPNPVNQAVHISLVLEAIKKKFPALPGGTLP